MKKNLLALAVFSAFSGAALAQSNVTIYGIIGVEYNYADPKGGQSATSSLDSGTGPNGSRWGLRGTETITPALSAVFTIEGGFNADTGTQGQGGRLFGRQAWVGLAHTGLGTLVGGRLDPFSSGTGSFDMFARIDPFITGFSDAGLGRTFTSAGTLRLDNSVLYSSPTWGGLKIGGGYSFNGNGTESPGQGTNNTKIAFFGVNFTRGPIYAAVTYDIFEAPNAGVPGSATVPRIDPNASDQRDLQAGVVVDLKFVRLHGAYAYEENVHFTSGLGTQASAGADANAWMGGVTVPLGNGELLASYQRRNGNETQVCLSAALGPCPATALQKRDIDREVWSIGYSYFLSRRTKISVLYADTSTDQDFNTTGALFSPLLRQPESAANDRRLYQVGIRTLF